jgi:hypothetical protein
MGDFVFWGELRPLRAAIHPMSHPFRTPGPSSEVYAGHRTTAPAVTRPQVCVPRRCREDVAGSREVPSGSGQGAERQRAGRRAAAGRAPSGSGQGADFCAEMRR